MDCFEAIVDKWLSDAWLSTHKSAKARRAQMVGVAHHQGNLNVNEYAKKWVCAFLFSVSCPFIITQLICFMPFLFLILNSLLISSNLLLHILICLRRVGS